MIKDIIKNKSTRLFIILGGFFIANALIAETIGVKIFSLEATFDLPPANIPIFGYPFSFNLTAGVLLWPVVFVMTDIINEYYGKRGVKFLSNLTVGLLAYAFLIYYLAIQLVPADWWITSKTLNGVNDMQAGYQQILGQGAAIIFGSLTAFLLGQVIDVGVFHKIKQMTGEKYIWLRSTGSTVVSQFIDSFVVLFIAFYFVPKYLTGQPWPFKMILAIGVGNYIYKFIVAIVLTPVIYFAHHYIDKYLGDEIATKMKNAATQNN
ncbi:MAG TPA: queuosine precursor transporter [Chitinophagales bacterium]|nr:queuosine precursor transporter [Chitinophagales bacterium]HMV03451.1 queuosine precursor transporter [Chitinophagales bacterium]HND45242.1 queuosine precursor transporter [Chitinophagales bacterium]HNK90369.1 queuosine precursor transporter [Chitinophagales bacterium]